MAPATKKKAEKEFEVKIRHGLFRYHKAIEQPSGLMAEGILKAQRGDVVTITASDYDRGMAHQAFFPSVDSNEDDSVGIPQPRTLETDASAGDDAFDFKTASDEELSAFLQRADVDTIIAKCQGDDDALMARVLAVEYQNTDGAPRPELSRVLVDLLGENPEEDDDGNWINEPELDEANEEHAAKIEQRQARKAAGRAKTTRSTTQDSGA